MSCNLGSLQELKQLLGISPTNVTQDVKLYFLLSYATSWIEEFLNRKGLFVSERTEYYSGTNSIRLLLRGRPVYASPTPPAVWVDRNGYWGATSGSYNSNTQLTYGVDYSLQIDQSEGTSRSAVLVKMKGVWEKNLAREAGWLAPFVVGSNGSIKVQYTAGYTTENMPTSLRSAVNLLVMRFNYLMPLGMELSSESYEERSISILGERRDYLMSLIKPVLGNYRNWNF